jgi:hypothetical protein
MKYLVILALALSGCAVKLESDPIKVDGTVKHVVQIDATQLSVFYTTYCKAKFSDQDEVDQCVTDSLVLFWQAIEQASPQQ